MSGEAQEIESSTVVVREPWQPFDARTRAQFCDLLRNGVTSRRRAVSLMRLNPATVDLWLSRGKRPVYVADDYEHRLFYLDVREAEAARDAVADMKLLEAAVGSVEEEKEEPDGSIVRRRRPGDWRAAVELGKRQERQALLAQDVRLQKARADEAAANARIAAVKAAVAEQAAKKIAAMVIFQPEFLQRCKPEERSMIEQIMARERFIEAPEEMIDEVLSGQDVSDIDELEEGLRRHPMRERSR